VDKFTLLVMTPWGFNYKLISSALFKHFFNKWNLCFLLFLLLQYHQALELLQYRNKRCQFKLVSSIEVKTSFYSKSYIKLHRFAGMQVNLEDKTIDFNFQYSKNYLFVLQMVLLGVTILVTSLLVDHGPVPRKLDNFIPGIDISHIL